MYYYNEFFDKLNKLDESYELEETFQTHGELNQQLFDQHLLREDVRRRLVEIADLFIEDIKEQSIPINVIDYWLLGSNAAYNYGPKSDIDIHIIVNMEDLGVDPYILQVLYNYIKSDFNSKYDIIVKGHEVELYIEDVRSGAVTNGIYSLKKDKWIKEPIRTEIMSYDVIETDEYQEWYNRYLELKENEIEDFINDLYLMRKESLVKNGEWGTGNLVFKEFRNSGILQDLKDRKYKYKSKELTLEGLNEQLLQEKVDPRVIKILGDAIYRTSNMSGQGNKYKKQIQYVESLHPGQYKQWAIHHFDGNHSNNKEENLGILPNECHSYLHSKFFSFCEELIAKQQLVDLDSLDLVARVEQINTFIKKLNNTYGCNYPVLNVNQNDLSDFAKLRDLCYSHYSQHYQEDIKVICNKYPIYRLKDVNDAIKDPKLKITNIKY